MQTYRSRTALEPIHPSRRRPGRRRRLRRIRLSLILAVSLLVLTLAAAVIVWAAGGRGDSVPDGNDAASSLPDGLGGGQGKVSTAPAPVSVPDWVTVNLLPLNEYSRPGDALPQVNGVVVHYVGNPGTTAEQNRSYFANLAQTGETYASSHFLVGIDGTVVQCVPLDEIAYCSTTRNADTISIECCHRDEEGEFSEETMDSLVRLLDWLIETYDLRREDVIRHYDVAGKECPVYYVRCPEAWEALLDKLTFPSKADA